MRKRLENYRQNVEGELCAMIFGIIGLLTVSAGFIWAVVFALRWVLR